MRAQHISFELTYPDGSSRTVTSQYIPFYSGTSSNVKAVSFKYIGDPKIVNPASCELLAKYFCSQFHTNQFLWQVSLSTCPEVLKPYLILEPEQLTYKGSANA